MVSSFIPGLELSRIFYEEAVKPILSKHYSTVKYDAALIGTGSEVLGFDDFTSTDHHWGPRLQLFLSDDDYRTYKDDIKAILSKELPYSIRGYSTHWSEPDPNDSMSQFLKPVSSGFVNHRVEIYDIKSYLRRHLNIEQFNLTDIDWLVLPEQKLLELTAGEVFYTGLNDLPKVRESFRYFPRNVWLFKMISEWDHLAEEMTFVGRTGSIGDDLGSRIETSRLVRRIIRLSFILSKKYVPYYKWRALAFSRLPIAQELHPRLLKILKEDNWRNREKLLCQAYLILLSAQNSLQITPEISLKTSKFYSRDQIVINIQKILKLLKKLLKPPLSEIKYPLGSIDHFIDDTHILTDALFAKNAKIFFE